MNLRHGFAVAFGGWLLIMPPPMRSQPSEPDVSAPLAKWAIQKNDLPSEADCERLKDRVVEMMGNPQMQATIDSRQAQKLNWDHAVKFAEAEKCVESDDPGFRGN